MFSEFLDITHSLSFSIHQFYKETEKSHINIKDYPKSGIS